MVTGVLKMKIGDAVVAVSPFQLVCGSGRYTHAVVVGLDPLVLVSEYGDMLWHATLEPGCVRSIGRASAESFERAMRRYDSDVGHKMAPAQKKPPESSSGERS